MDQSLALFNDSNNSSANSSIGARDKTEYIKQVYAAGDYAAAYAELRKLNWNGKGTINPRLYGIFGALYYLGLVVAIDRKKAESIFGEGHSNGDMYSSIYLVLLYSTEAGHLSRSQKDDLSFVRKLESLVNPWLGVLKSLRTSGKQDGEAYWLLGSLALRLMGGQESSSAAFLFRKAAQENFLPAFCRYC